MGRPPIKATKALVKAELEANAKFQLSPKGLQVALIEMIQRIDPIALVAQLGSTILVFNIIKGSEELIAAAQMNYEALKKSPFGFLFPSAGTFQGDLLATVLQAAIGAGIPLTEADKNQIANMIQPDWIIWLEAFAISFFLIKTTSAITEGKGGISGVVASYLGMEVY